MVKATAVLVVYAIIGALEVWPLAQRRLWRETALTAAVVLAAAIYGTGLTAGWPLLNPVAVVRAVFGPVAALLGMP